MLQTKGRRSHSGDRQSEAEISRRTWDLGEIWLKEHLWDRYHKHWVHKVLGRNYCRCMLMLQMQETPCYTPGQAPQPEHGGFMQSREQMSAGDPRMAILCFEASAGLTQPKNSRGVMVLQKFCLFYLFQGWGFLFVLVS